MALEYEVRPEYRSMSLEQLLDSPVRCFEGVGNTQNEILSRYFNITTVRQLANMPYFLWALGIQELALSHTEPSSKPIKELSEGGLKFSITNHEMGKNAVELLNSPVNVLEGLTPAQNLAMYDAFRVTNVVQLAHNRIMLEARVIEYLQKHPELMHSSEQTDKQQIASILGTETTVPGSGHEAQGILTEKKPSERESLKQMAGELNAHLRSRIDALRDRAAERTKNISSSAEALGAKGSTGTEGGASSASSRADALRTIRRRTESNRVSPAQHSSSPERSAAGSTENTATRGDSSISPATGSTEAVDTGWEESERKSRNLSLTMWILAVVLLLLVTGLIFWFLSRSTSFVPNDGQATGAAEGSATEPAATGTTASTAGETTSTGASIAGSTAGETTSTGAAAGPAVRTTHIVVKGESLWRISRRHYDNPLLWPQIYRSNDDQIADPNLIYPDQQFKIPEP